MAYKASGGMERTIFTLHIITELKNAFPVPIVLEKHRVFESISGFTELRIRAEEAKIKLADLARSGERLIKLAQNDLPEATAEIGNKARGAWAGAGWNRDFNSLPLLVEKYRRKVRELSEIWDSTVDYLQAQGDIREIDHKFQLAEPGIADHKTK